MSTYQILKKGKVVNTIQADAAFVEQQYPGNYRLVPDVVLPVSRKSEILAALTDIDAQTDKPRTHREIALGNAKTISWVAGLDAQALALRTELALL